MTIIFQSFSRVGFLKILLLWGQISKYGLKGMKMIRKASEIDLAQLVFCVPTGCPHKHFNLCLEGHVSPLHVAVQKHWNSVKEFFSSNE